MFNGNGNNGMYMPVAPAYGGGYGGSGFGFGGDGIWGGLLLGLLFGGLGGWGGFGGFGGGWGNMMGMDAMMMFPYFFNTQTQNELGRGFDTQNLAAQISSLQNSINDVRTGNQLSSIQQAITSGFGDTALGIAGVNQNICQTGNGVVSAITGAQNSLAQQMYSNQIADLERSFAAQTANTAGMNNLATQFANCCCENRLGIANLGSDIAREACATRTADTQNTQAILNVINGGIQSIKDQLCQDKIDAKNDEIAQLRQEILYARGQASQTDQTAQLLANNNAQTAIFQQGLNNEVDALYNRLNNCPVATVPVYGRQPIFNCNQNNGMGCGCGY